MKKLIVTIIAVVVVVGGGAFYSGMKYGQSKITEGFRQGDFQNFRNMFQGNANGTFFGSGIGSRNGTNFISGEIIAKDENSITLKLAAGSSKIVFYSNSTEIQKSAAGTSGDLIIGQTVSINGKTNDEGSITAQSIQLRPNMIMKEP